MGVLQLGGLGNDVENLKFKHQYELEIAKIPLSEAATEDMYVREGWLHSFQVFTI